MRLPCERRKICKGTKLRGEKQEGYHKTSSINVMQLQNENASANH